MVVLHTSKNDEDPIYKKALECLQDYMLFFSDA